MPAKSAKTIADENLDSYMIPLPSSKKLKIEALLQNPHVVEDALIKCGGWVSRAAKMLGCSPLILSQVISKCPELLETFSGIKESYLDIAEYQLLKLVREGNLDAVKFWLRCQGKKRGWFEKTSDFQEPTEESLTIKIEPAPGISFEFTETVKKEAEEQMKQIEAKVLNQTPLEPEKVIEEKSKEKSEKELLEDESMWESV